MLILLHRPHILAFQSSARLSNIDQIWSMTERFLSEEHLDGDLFSLQLGLREALSNAILHGCGSQGDRKVFCELEAGGEELTVTVRDPGKGFDWGAMPRVEPPPENEVGRGLALIEKCFDEVSFNETGNEISLTKRLVRKGGSMSDVIRAEAGATILPGRDLVASTVEEVRNELTSLVDEGYTNLTIDLTGVRMVDSLGMGLFVATHNSLLGKGGSLTLVNVPERIYDILSMMRLTRHFTVHKAPE
ncbi:Sulfate transporter/antisigma-factor antagonist STAS [Desulfovibrio sp. X2]|uniref:ATP-binding protein n=1 Tax=Desulfovibrio sp. X2 TaxID=941449 RepID=UPI000358E5D5|nr:ATP-binding protein [Desulfovibrio sp. X2]EPR44242.1 Sulfate transporter/antisigma-factor antagonist STAS [Desulfovibrio sp. X2]